jgi:hypothetical protein
LAKEKWLDQFKEIKITLILFIAQAPDVLYMPTL